MPYEYGLRSRQAVIGAQCDSCGRRWKVDEVGVNLDGGSRITIEGWYGATLDTVDHQVPAVLCDACTRLFVRAWFPHLVTELRPE